MPQELVQLTPLDLTILATYFLGVLLFGAYIARRVRTDKDYFLAGRSLPFWAIGLSIVGSDIGAVDLVGLVGNTFRNGLVMANMDWIGTMPAIILAAFVFIPYYWRAGVYSVPEYLGRRYDTRVRIVQTLAWTLFMVSNLGITFWATGEMFEGLLGWPKPFTIAVMAVFTGIYTISGGLMADVWTDVVQVVIMLSGAAIVVVRGLARLGGVEGLSDRILELGHTQHLTLYHSAASSSSYAWPQIFVGLTLVLAPAYFCANQSIVQRTLGARDEWSAKAGALFGGFFKFSIPFLVVVPGLIGVAMYPGLENPDQAFSLLVRDLLPEGIRGIVVAAFVAGFMSNVDSMLNSSSTLITQDLWRGALRRELSDVQALRVGRWITLSLIVFGACAAPITAQFKGVYNAIQSMLAIIQGPTIAILFTGMFWRRATAAAGFVAVVAGLSLSISLTVYHKLTEGSIFPAEDPFFFVAPIACFATVAILVVVSLFTQPKSPEELRGLIYERRPSP
jgi:SSS family solute:Na+ symporter